MTRQEHLLICLAEECAEVIYDVSKILRFGINDNHPKVGVPNGERLQTEINDVFTIINMLQAEGFELDINSSAMVEKQKKVERYIAYAKERGTITP